jgi:hypothetical protein
VNTANTLLEACYEVLRLQKKKAVGKLEFERKEYKETRKTTDVSP